MSFTDANNVEKDALVLFGTIFICFVSYYNKHIFRISSLSFMTFREDSNRSKVTSVKS